MTVFTQKKPVADVLQAKCDFRWKTAVLRFLSPLWLGLGATYDVRLRLIGKRVDDFLLVFLLDATAEALRANID